MILAAILLVLWLLGLVGTYSIGAFVHVLSSPRWGAAARPTKVNPR
jgi:hypothetical protein